MLYAAGVYLLVGALLAELSLKHLTLTPKTKPWLVWCIVTIAWPLVVIAAARK